MRAASEQSKSIFRATVLHPQSSLDPAVPSPSRVQLGPTAAMTEADCLVVLLAWAEQLRVHPAGSRCEPSQQGRTRASAAQAVKGLGRAGNLGRSARG